jgi:hypothetical protein
MTRALLTLAALLAGCPSSLRTHGVADCCRPGTADAAAGCDWEPIRYSVPSLADDLRTDEGTCRRAGLEPYE